MLGSVLFLLPNFEGSINKTEYELIDTDHEHDETEQKLSSNVNEDTSEQRVVVTKVIGQENKDNNSGRTHRHIDGQTIPITIESFNEASGDNNTN
jgi:hypothetical protein